MIYIIQGAPGASTIITEPQELSTDPETNRQRINYYRSRKEHDHFPNP